ncbi:unnamed protein product, partial [Angiostrongylus costaricensis]|uniref:Phosphatase tensin-type domain-containing protein n=1 Tax=Angiostrongylus costaricensis TaxID=334426 RepID=A0A158PIS6_ANGCS
TYNCSVQDVVDLVFNPLRSVISQNRRRYTEDDITDRIIAMGYPARSIERLYRNSMYHTVKFLERHHAGHYKVFNLRGNYFYKVEKFHGRVGLYHMKDHQPPRLDLMDPFCKEVSGPNLFEFLSFFTVASLIFRFLQGRTGVMICAYLVSIKFYEEPRQVMDYYSIVRTVNNKGVTIPSQRRYIYYYAQMLKYGLTYTPLRIELVGVYVERPPQPAVVLFCLCVFIFFLFVQFLFRIDEERLWSGKVPFGEDSYDPSSDSFDVNNTCVSRFAYSRYLVRSVIGYFKFLFCHLIF